MTAQLLSKELSTVQSSFTSFLADVSTSTDDYLYRDGISLLAVKNDTMLDYLHHLVLVCLIQLKQSSLSGEQGRKVVENLVKLRLVVEKARPLENRLRYQIDKLLRAADDEDRQVMLGRKAIDVEDEEEEEDDLLAFRPNPTAFMQDKARKEAPSRGRQSGGFRQTDGGEQNDDDNKIYRPPRLVPVSYDPDASNKKKRGDKHSDSNVVGRSSALLSDLTASFSSNPFEQSSGGVGVGGNVINFQTSGRARALQRMQEYEEDNFTRLVMSKKDAKKRRRDEADIALGGSGLSSGKDGRQRISGGMEEEFGDLLRSSGFSGKRGKNAKRVDAGYQKLRSDANGSSLLSRSKRPSSSSSTPSSSTKANRFGRRVQKANKKNNH